MLPAFRDLLGWLLTWRAAWSATRGPYRLAAAECYIAGAEAGRCWISGAAAGEVYLSGSAAGECNA